MPRNNTVNPFPVSLSMSPLTVTTTPNQSANQVDTEIKDNADFTIPAGKIRAFIKNVGANVPGGANSHITVNGERVEIGQSRLFEIVEDKTTSPHTTKFTPEVVVVTNGAYVEGSYTE